uniref:Secreted protein n=1 Tax=Syphacia muris TaxID=451379 RepID=A0A0N5AG87_9BILA
MHFVGHQFVESVSGLSCTISSSCTSNCYTRDSDSRVVRPQRGGPAPSRNDHPRIIPIANRSKQCERIHVKDMFRRQTRNLGFPLFR